MLICPLPGAGGRTRIVAVTADAMRGDRERFLAAGMEDVLAKPFNRAALAAVLDAAGAMPATVPAAIPLAGQGSPAVPLPAVDAEARAELVADIGAGAVRRITDAFALDLAASLPAVAAAIGAGDLGAARAGAHRLASAAGNLGFARLAAGLSALDRACRSDTVSVAGALAEVESAARDAATAHATDRDAA